LCPFFGGVRDSRSKSRHPDKENGPNAPSQLDLIRSWPRRMLCPVIGSVSIMCTGRNWVLIAFDMYLSCQVYIKLWSHVSFIRFPLPLSRPFHYWRNETNGCKPKYSRHQLFRISGTASSLACTDIDSTAY